MQVDRHNFGTDEGFSEAINVMRAKRLVCQLGAETKIYERKRWSTFKAIVYEVTACKLSV